MRLTLRALAWGLLLPTAAFILAGCGASGPSSGTVGGQSTQTIRLQPFSDNANQTPRWRDIADYLYSNSFRNSFKYPGTVLLSYTTQETPLRFTLSAPRHGLKPNFCYQMKLEGPSQLWSNDPQGADFVNYQFGSHGRWWCDTGNRALTDTEVASGAHNGHVVKGYIYFDFAVTNRDGSAYQSSTVSNSYHVTWKTSQRSRTANDGPVRTSTVVATSDGWAYSGYNRSVNVGVYGEWEPGRPLPGSLALASGTYSGVQFRLTEESFHSTLSYGGNWRTALSASVPAFQISVPLTPS